MALLNNLTKHLDNAEHFTVAGQVINVGIMRVPSDHILAILTIDAIVSETEARWLGAQIKADVLTWVRTYQPETPDELVTFEVKADGAVWRLGVYTYHNTLEDANLVSTFLNQYAALTMPVAPGSGTLQ